MANSIKILGEIIAANSAEKRKLKVAKLPTGTLIEIPIYVFNAPEKGPVVLVQAALHGDEINGIETLKRILLSNKLKNLIKGTVLVVPLLNVFGFIHYSRDVTNGKDANRSFPGTKNGSLASRIAYKYTKEILNIVDYGIDLHTGGAQRSNYPQTRYASDLKMSKQLSDWFAAPIAFESKLIPKSIRKTAADKGIPFIVYEGGESMRLDNKSISVAENGIYRVLYNLGMLNENPKVEENPVTLSNRKWLRAKSSGIFVRLVDNGSKIIKNQIIGAITDAYGENEVKIKAPFDACVFCVNNQAVISQGEALFHIGRYI